MYWLGYLSSALGDAIFILVVSWLIVQKTNSGIIMGNFLLVVGVPRVILMILGGVIVDRFSPKKVMLFSDLLRALLLIIFAILSTTGGLHLPVLFILGAAFGIVDAFYWPSVTAIRQRIVNEPQYSQANSILAGTGQVSIIIGPLLGAGLISFAGFNWSFSIIGLLFLFSAATLFFIKLKTKQLDNENKIKKSILTDMLEGAKFVRQSPLLLAIILTALFGNAAMSTITVGLPFLAKEYQVGAEGLGQMSASLGIGGIVISILLSLVLIIKKPNPRIMMTVLFLQGLLILFIGYTQNHWQVALIMGLIGSTGAFLGILEQSISQSIIPQHLMGRVYSIILVVAQGVTPLAQALSGWLIDLIGVHSIYFFGGPVQMIVALIGFFLPAVAYYGKSRKEISEASVR